MKKFYVIAVVLLLVAAVTTSFSQMKLAFGPKIGLVLANASFDPDLPSGITKSTRTGFAGGAAFEMMFSNVPLGIEADLFYAMGGNVLEATINNVKVTETSKVDFIQIPILFKGKLPTNSIVTPYAFVGPALAFVATAKTVDEATGFQTTETDTKDQTTSMDFQLLFGAGADFQIERKVNLTFDFRYGLGLTDMVKNPGVGDPKIKTRGIYFLVGAMFTL